MSARHLRSSVVVLAILLGLAAPVRAERASCEDLLSARELGRSIEEVAATFRTTRARVATCERIAAHHAELAAKRQATQDARAERGIE